LVVTGVFSFVVTNLMFPKMSRANVSGSDGEAKELLVMSLKLISLVILPVMAVFIVLSKPIIAIIYQHGDFLPADTLRTGSALSCYAIGMIGMAYNEILSKSFFSMQNSKTPMINALISMAANIIAAYTLSGPLGISGLAVASAFGSTVNAVLNYICMRRHYRRLIDKADIADILKMAVSSIAMGIVMLVIYKILLAQTELNLISGIIIGAVCGIAGLIVYSGGCLVLRIGFVKNILKGGGKNE
ncbi:MAG: lipid II flippase MurJ, partial [Clostridiales bacterium]|nr:lipid II flippase MurJ [Clostridiales bacterium]